MLDNIKKYWFLYTPLAALIIWGVSINSRIFDNPEQKVEHENHVKNSLSPVQQQRKYILDSVDKNSAIKKRAASLKQQKRSDSIRAKNDSLFLDMVKRQTVQIEQIKALIDTIK